ncbi:hypothetical protein J7K18_03800, partial [bacterium]|nr:hypothetical protein [bacterium]
HGSPYPTVGRHYFTIGTEVTAFVEQNVYDAEGVRWHCTGWEGTGSVDATGSDTTTTFTINENSSITWLWVRQYLLTITSAHGSPYPPIGEHWYDIHSVIDGYVNRFAIEGTDTFVCIGYDATGSIMGDIDTTFHCVIDTPTTVNWLWEPLLETVTLTVYSDYGSPYPSVGVHYFTVGTYIAASVDPFVEIDDGVRQFNTGWSGTGSVPESGTTHSVEFTIEENSTITWNWQLQYRFTVTSEHGTPYPSVGEHWYDEESEVLGYINRFAIEGTDTFVCTGYTGYGSLGSGIDTMFSFTIYEPSEIVWNWEYIGEARSLTVISEFDTPTPAVGTHYFRVGTDVGCSIADSIVTFGTGRRVSLGWIGTGSAPAEGDSTHFSFIIDENSTVTWLWQKQFYISLDYSGCGSAIPAQEGEGWYVDGDTAYISTEENVSDGTTTFAFYTWVPDDPRAVIDDVFNDSTFVVVDTSYIITAQYRHGVEVTIEKEPAEPWGHIYADGVDYEGAASISFWWAFGTYHEIGVSAYDTLGDERWVFNNWSDERGIVHTVGPIETDTTFTAYYQKQYRCIVEKDPDADTLGYLVVDGATYTGTASVYQMFWWDEGSTHELEASEIDTTEDARFVFNSWSDFGERAHTTAPIFEPTEFIAFYDGEYPIVIKKSPPENYGWIMVDSTLYPDTSFAKHWAIAGAVHTVGVSEYDYSDYHTFTFDHWSDLLPREHSLPPLVEPETLIAYYTVDTLIVEVAISRNSWWLDSVVINETRTMDEDEVITISNYGNTHITLGLQIISSGTVWRAGIINGEEMYSLRARFNDLDTPPSAFEMFGDNVKTSPVWADAETFGPGGFGIPPFPDPDHSENLWMQFRAPTRTSVFRTQTISLKLLVRPCLP